MVMDNNDRAQRACILLADYEPLVILIHIILLYALIHYIISRTRTERVI